jgi:hypothetical protein
MFTAFCLVDGYYNIKKKKKYKIQYHYNIQKYFKSSNQKF